MIDIAGFDRDFRSFDDLVLDLKGLVLVHALLEERGATDGELREHADAIASLRKRLATVLRKGGGAQRAAA